MKVIVLTSGEYSDYSIKAVFSTRKLAKEWADKADAADEYPMHRQWNYEEWEVDSAKEDEVITVWGCGIMLDSGEIVEEAAYKELVAPFRSKILQKCVNVPLYHNRPTARVQSGVSAEHARKVAVETRQAWLRKKGLE